MSKEQVPTNAVSLQWIMSGPSFSRGAADCRAGRPYPSSFDEWTTNEQWNYERGRAWASRVPASVVIKRNGKLTNEALYWARCLGDDIL